MAKKKLSDAMLLLVASIVVLLKSGRTDEDAVEEATFDYEGDEELTDELRASLLEEAKATIEKEKKLADQKAAQLNAGVLMYGNKDKKKEYEFPKTWEKSIVVRISQVTKIGSGAQDVVEIPSTVKVKPFAADLFEVHVKQDMFKGRKVRILHDPRE
jgi:hypothetical protein